MEMKLPFLGDGVDSATVLSILVKPGDTVKKEDTLLELETEKAVAPIPSDFDGTIDAILVKEGDVVKEGVPVISFSGSGGSSARAESAPVQASPAPIQTQTQPASAVQVSVQQPVTAAVSQEAYQQVNTGNIATSPSIRQMAASIGLDLGRIPGTGHGGRITLDDVRAYVNTLQVSAFQTPQAASVRAVAEPVKPKKETPDFSKWGPVSAKPLSQMRVKIAEKMSESWNDIPHVTQFDEADITDLMGLRKKYKDKFAKKNANLTMTGFALKAVVAALKEFPVFNASLDEVNNQLIYKEYYHIGVAVDTEHGLVVPVIRDVDKKSVLQLSLELGEIAQKARDRKLTMDDMQGGTFTISNLGGLGVSHFTPIVNAPEVAILGMARGNLKPVIRDKKIDQRLMLPLGLSYDHRVIDGADGARFTRTLIDAFETFSESYLKEK